MGRVVSGFVLLCRSVDDVLLFFDDVLLFFKDAGRTGPPSFLVAFLREIPHRILTSSCLRVRILNTCPACRRSEKHRALAGHFS